MSVKSLRIECNDIFPIIGRGLVFRGFVMEGTAKAGDRVVVQGNERGITASISAVERNRQIVEASVKGIEQGFLLIDFSLPEINEAIQAKYDDLERYPEASHYHDLLGISSFPFSLSAINE